ncbi:hypothetical protein BGZ83_005475 [Gryganskiella cystojenkinii]|nr:hypothetical protein BGZ83_005475 [Gryganskiella cystojenkinii]
MDPQEKLEAMFCPRLDSALVASIYHDLGDFKACVPILSALASAAGPSSETDPQPQPLSSNTPGSNSNNNNNSINTNKKSAGTTVANNNNRNKKIPPSNDKNILIWSEQVANSTSDKPASSGSSKGYKQGQITNSSAYRAPVVPSSATSTSSPQAPAQTTAAALPPPKAAFRALRNPNFVRNNGLPAGMEPPPPPPMPGAYPEDLDEVADQDEDSNDDFENDTVSSPAPPPQLEQPPPQAKKKKNRRPKRSNNNKNNQTPDPDRTPSSPKQPRGTWKREPTGSTGPYEEEKILDQFSVLDLGALQSLPDKTGDDNDDNDDEEDEDDGEDADDAAGGDDISSTYSGNTSKSSGSNNNNSSSGISAEELEFLKSCFPDHQHSDEYLAQVFKDSRRDLEAAVELILSRMFLENEQVETSSSGSGSLISMGSQSTTSTVNSTGGSLDDAFFQGVQKSKKTPKGTSGYEPAWGGAGVKPKAPIVIPGITDQNDPLLNAIERQDEFLIPEANEWATFDHQISILMNIFHTVPQKIIVSEYHANGAQLFKTVESLENRLKRENYAGTAQGRQRQSQFDVNLAQLMEMFPDHSAQGLKKMLVYNAGNVQDAMNAVLAADLSRGERVHHQQQQKNGKRGTTIPFAADIRYADKAVTVATSTSAGTTRLRTLPSTNNPFPNGPKPFPNTLLDKSNAELYNDDDDPVWCRQRAHEVLEQRNALFRKAAKAYQATKGKGPGMGGIAAYYADEGKKLDIQGKQLHMRAARAVVQQHRIENNDPNLVDLHGLTIAEAQTVVREAVTQWFSRSTMQASRIAAKPLRIICGVGSHSKDRIARLYPTILNLLMKDGWRCEANNGVIIVKGVSKIMPGKK